MGPRVEAICLSAVDILDVEAEVVGAVDCLRMHLPDLAALNLAVVIVELAIVFVSPEVAGLKGVGMPSGLKDHVFVDIFDVQTGYSFDIFGQF